MNINSPERVQSIISGEMKVVKHAESHSMSWCLDCHRNPQDHVRPLDKDVSEFDRCILQYRHDVALQTKLFTASITLSYTSSISSSRVISRIFRLTALVVVIFKSPWLCRRRS